MRMTQRYVVKGVVWFGLVLGFLLPAFGLRQFVKPDAEGFPDYITPTCDQVLEGQQKLAELLKAQEEGDDAAAQAIPLWDRAGFFQCIEGKVFRVPACPNARVCPFVRGLHKRKH